MRDGWQQVRLGQILKLARRQAVIDPKATYKLVTLPLNGVGARLRKIVMGDEVGTAKYVVRAEDLMISKIDARKGSNSILPPELDGAIVTGDFLSYEVDKDRVTREMLDIIVRRREFAELCDTVSSGTTNRVRLDTKRFLELEVGLPPLPAQRRIVDLVTTVDDAIHAAEAEAAATAEARRTLWRDLAAESVCVGAVGTVTQGKSLPKAIQGTVSGDISWFKIADMTAPRNVFGYSEADTRVSRAVLDNNGGKLVPAGSVAFPRVGAAVATEKKRLLLGDAALDENHIVVTPIAGGAEEVLLASFESIRLGSLVRAGAVPSLNMGLIRVLEIPWPKKGTDLHKVNALLSANRTAEQNSRAHADALRTLRSDLLTVLLSGEHEIPSSYDRFLDEGVAA